MKRTIQIAVVLFALLPGIAKAQWTFDIVSVEAYINDHKKQRRTSRIPIHRSATVSATINRCWRISMRRS